MKVTCVPINIPLRNLDFSQFVIHNYVVETWNIFITVSMLYYVTRKLNIYLQNTHENQHFVQFR